MQIQSRGVKEKQPGPPEWFAGQVEIDSLAAAGGGLPGAIAVTFHDGARTHWHSHSDGQILYVIEGEGRVGTAERALTVGPGDLVIAPAGERHWHGAAEGHEMTHLALNFGETVWFEPVQ